MIIQGHVCRWPYMKYVRYFRIIICHILISWKASFHLFDGKTNPPKWRVHFLPNCIPALTKNTQTHASARSINSIPFQPNPFSFLLFIPPASDTPATYYQKTRSGPNLSQIITVQFFYLLPNLVAIGFFFLSILRIVTVLLVGATMIHLKVDPDWWKGLKRCIYLFRIYKKGGDS